jgi:hypothetical protein
VNEWPEAACGQLKDRQSDGQAKAPRPGTSGIEVEHSGNGLDSRPMRVAGNDYVNSAQHWIQPQFLDVVQYIDGMSTEPHHLGFRIFFRPLSGIDVASNRSHWSNPAQPCNNLSLANIAAVDDMRNARELLLSLRA